MSIKRDYDDLEDGAYSEPDTKRPRKQPQKQQRQHQNSSIDPTWGQKYVFSSSENATTIPVGEESDFEDDSDAMAYLMSEASVIPHLLVAPKVQIGPQLPAEFAANASNQEEGEVEDDQEEDEADHVDRSIYTEGIGDTRGYYDDGAYIGAPEEVEEYDDYEDFQDEDDSGEYVSEKALHEAYYASLMDQYCNLRKIVNSKPPPDAAKRLQSSHYPTHATSTSTSNNKIWARALRNTDPHPLQVALMSKESVLGVLRIILGGKFLRRGYPLPERTSRWLWAMLARLPDRGELGYAEIGWVRDLGKRAVLLGRSLAEMAALREELAEGGLGVNEGVDESSTDEDVLAQGEEQEDIEAKSANGCQDSASVGLSNSSASSQQVEAPGQAEPKADATKPPPEAHDEGEEEGEVAEDEEDVAMELASNSSASAVADDNAPGDEQLQDAKARLLAKFTTGEDQDEEDDDPDSALRERSRMNMRATLNMILSVAGEFYGQRDLLEFREPFVGM